jgi:hypothetical protein
LHAGEGNMKIYRRVAVAAEEKEEEEVSLGVFMANTNIFHIVHIFSLFNIVFSIFFISFHSSTFLSCPYLFTFQLAFLPYFPYYFTIF